jgi:hypothetical protein
MTVVKSIGGISFYMNANAILAELHNLTAQHKLTVYILQSHVQSSQYAQAAELERILSGKQIREGGEKNESAYLDSQ